MTRVRDRTRPIGDIPLDELLELYDSDAATTEAPTDRYGVRRFGTETAPARMETIPAEQGRHKG